MKTLKALKAHFDGNVLVPDEPVDLPLNRPLEVRVVALDESAAVPAPLGKLAALASEFPARATGRPDLATQHDHYLYGVPKRK